MNVTIKRGPNASALLGTFLSDVQYIPGVGKTRAASIHAGAVLTVTVPPDKIEGAVRNLRRLTGYRTVPILILTTESGDAMKSQGRTAGATGWLVKPFDPQRLLEVVKKVIG